MADRGCVLTCLLVVLVGAAWWPASAVAQTAPFDATSLVRGKEGGLTADAAADRALASSHGLVARRAAEREADAKVIAAERAFAPRLTLLARYARLSPFDPPALGGGGSLVGTFAPAGTVNPPSVSTGPLSFANILDQYTLQATLAVPVSDYWLRIDRGRRAAEATREAVHLDVQAAVLRETKRAKLGYYQWVLARGAVEVATQGLADSRAHLADARALFENGVASRGDVLRAEAAVADAELAVLRGQNGEAMAEKNVRTLLHTGDDLVPESDRETAPAPETRTVDALLDEARRRRPELASLRRSIAAVRLGGDVARAARYPAFSVFADGTYANPNPRYQPQADKWLGTWAVGAQLTYAIDQAWAAGANEDAAMAKAAELTAAVAELEDGISLEITQARLDLHEADLSIAATERARLSAEEAYRVTADQYRQGRLPAVALFDVETQLTRARLGVVTARIAAKTARIRLEAAIGARAEH